MFDRSFLPPADFRFVLLADTHHVYSGMDPVEFDSRRRQNARTKRAIEMINGLEPAFVVHLGDIVQEFPESAAFEDATDEALDVLSTLSVERYQVAGNHDVGDKPDPTMPTAPVTASSLRNYHRRFGRSWYHWTAGGIDFFVLNSQLLNAPLKAAADQREWFEAALEDATGPKVVLSHLPPFLHDPDEPVLGHYDNIGSPGREWLLECVRTNAVDWLFCAHSHFAFFNRVGPTRMAVVPSPAFTRPGFAELFSASPPPERGRDDRPKLGFYLVSVRDGELHPAFIRTSVGGDTPSDPTARRLLTRRTGFLPGSPVGVSLVHPLSDTATVPAVFPSTVRQTVHNDYGLAGCLELGVRTVRTPLADRRRPRVARTLDRFRRAGGRVVGTVQFAPGDEPTPLGRAGVDEIEVRLVGDAWTPAEIAAVFADDLAFGADSTAVSASRLTPDLSRGSTQHDRPRTGFAPGELQAVNESLRERGTTLDRALCRFGTSAPWKAIRCRSGPDERDRIEAVDWLLSGTIRTDDRFESELLEAILGVACRPGERLYIEPLRELDRTMDRAAGLLDRRDNPTRTFHAVRCLNTVLFAGSRDWYPVPTADPDGGRAYGLSTTHRTVLVVVPDRDAAVRIDEPLRSIGADPPSATRTKITLSDGRIRPLESDPRRRSTVTEPTAIWMDEDGRG